MSFGTVGFSRGFLPSCSAGQLPAQQNMLWQGVVKPEAINVYQSASTNEHVTGTLRQGDAVDVVLQVSVSGSEWCRVTRAGASEPVGFVLCLNLQQGAASLEQVAHTQQVASQSHPWRQLPRRLLLHPFLQG